MIALVDYGVGNLRSVEKALETALNMAQEAGGTAQDPGQPLLLTDRAEDLLRADKIVLPGVGAFGDGMAGLRQRGLVEPLLEAVHKGIPLLGICLGMQLLFETSEEMGKYAGLGLLPGKVVRFPAQNGLKIPQTGWNQVIPTRDSVLLEGLPPGSYAYFNHSYYCVADTEHILGITDYGLEYASVVGKGCLYGIQFHPEKSQAVGLQILRNFVERG